MTAVVSTLIELDERGVAWITGTKVKVIEAATDKLAHGSSPEEMHFQYPHLSLAQIYAALSLRQRFCARQSVPKPGPKRPKIPPYGSGSRSGACCLSVALYFDVHVR
jgi:uncharacterized protein (DUF433 family)